MFVHITKDDRNQPFEVFINVGRAGGSAMADAEAMGRLISLALRSGIPLMSVIKQLRGISSDRTVGLGPNKVLSVPDAVGLALHDWHQAKLGIQQELLGEYPAFESATPVATPVVVPVSGQGGAQAEADEYYADNKSFIGTCPDCGSQLCVPMRKRSSTSPAVKWRVARVRWMMQNDGLRGRQRTSPPQTPPCRIRRAVRAGSYRVAAPRYHDSHELVSSRPSPRPRATSKRWVVSISSWRASRRGQEMPNWCEEWWTQ